MHSFKRIYQYTHSNQYWTKDCKDRIIKYVKPLYDQYLNTYKKNYGGKNLKDKEKRGCDYIKFEIIDNRDQGPKKDTETKKLMKYKNHYGLK